MSTLRRNISLNLAISRRVSIFQGILRAFPATVKMTITTTTDNPRRKASKKHRRNPKATHFQG